MLISWSNHSWEDYLFWQKYDKKILLRINKIVRDIKRDPFTGIGSPEALKHEWGWSRRINREHRLVYKIQNDQIFIAQCRYHY